MAATVALPAAPSLYQRRARSAGLKLGLDLPAPTAPSQDDDESPLLPLSSPAPPLSLVLVQQQLVQRCQDREEGLQHHQHQRYPAASPQRAR